MKTNLLLFALFTYSISYGQTPAWQWAKSEGRYTSHDYSYGIGTDAAGNSYITGEFQDTIVFGSTTLINTGTYNQEMYFAKYDAQGNVIWAFTPTGNNSSTGQAIAVDASGNFYLTGAYKGNLILGTASLTGTTFLDNVFVAKFDSSGNCLWAHDGQSYFSDKGTAICVGGDGSVIVTGIHEDSAIIFNNITVPSFGSNDIFIVKYDSNGNLLWATGGGGLQDDRSAGIATDVNGDIYVTGNYRNSIAFGSVNVAAANSGGASVFTLKLDPGGNPLWAKSSGAFPCSGYGNAISADANGCYVTGYFGSPIIYFDNDTLTNAGVEDIFLIKYDNNGNLRYASRAGGNDFDRGNSVKTDLDGNCYVGGFFKSSVCNFGANNLFATNQDVFVAKFDSSGNALWGVQSTGSLNEVCNGITLLGNDLYLSGEFSSPIANFGSLSLANSDAFLGSYDLYVAKLSGLLTGITGTNTTSKTISIFPNPVKGITKFRINNSSLNISEVYIYDLQGRIVKTMNVDSDYYFEMDFSQVSSGMYFYKVISTSNEFIGGKILVEN